MPTASYDLVVIGAGPGGYVAAIRAAQLGMRVACVERDSALGGTCLNVGCIPSKALLESSERFAAAGHDFEEHGIGVDNLRLDLRRMMKRKQRVVQTLTKGIAGLFRKNGVDSIPGEARFTSPRELAVSGEDERSLAADRILIATGSTPIELANAPFDGDRVLSSTEALSLDEVPGTLVVVGAGAIGLELGSVWNRLGAEVTVIEIQDEALPGMDPELASGLRQALAKQGMRFRLGCKMTDCSTGADRVELTVEGGDGSETMTADRLLVAVGRRANTAGLGLDAIGLEPDERGRIVVDERYRTAVEGVYAIGDVIAGPMLAHKAEEEGVAAVELMKDMAGHVNYRAIPNVVYTAPEVASVGLTEAQASSAGHSTRTGKFPFRANGRARCAGSVDGFVKILADASSDEILGIHILGPHASELIAEAAVAIEFSASAEDLARSVHAHPTLAEAIKEAALAVGERGIHF